MKFITPPSAHGSMQSDVNTGILLTNRVGNPGTQGPAGAGTQGAPVIKQAPNGMTFTIGILSIIFAAGILPAVTIFFGRHMYVDGAAPIAHLHIELEHITKAI